MCLGTGMYVLYKPTLRVYDISHIGWASCNVAKSSDATLLHNKPTPTVSKPNVTITVQTAHRLVSRNLSVGRYCPCCTRFLLHGQFSIHLEKATRTKAQITLSDEPVEDINVHLGHMNVEIFCNDCWAREVQRKAFGTVYPYVCTVYDIPSCILADFHRLYPHGVAPILSDHQLVVRDCLRDCLSVFLPVGLNPAQLESICVEIATLASTDMLPVPPELDSKTPPVMAKAPTGLAPLLPVNSPYSKESAQRIHKCAQTDSQTSPVYTITSLGSFQVHTAHPCVVSGFLFGIPRIYIGDTPCSPYREKRLFADKVIRPSAIVIA